MTPTQALPIGTLSFLDPGKVAPEGRRMGSFRAGVQIGLRILSLATLKFRKPSTRRGMHPAINT